MRPPSSAGKGRILITPRLIERSAIITRMMLVGTLSLTIETKVDPSPIGPASIAFASVCSTSFFGLKSPVTIFERNQKVTFVVARVSLAPFCRAVNPEY